MLGANVVASLDFAKSGKEVLNLLDAGCKLLAR